MVKYYFTKRDTTHLVILYFITYKIFICHSDPVILCGKIID